MGYLFIIYMNVTIYQETSKIALKAQCRQT